jgi:hypothetical protein
MSRTLKRPMFRDGGRANSKGTGIMSGIEDREGFQNGNIVSGNQNFGRVRIAPEGRSLFDLLNLGQLGSGSTIGQTESGQRIRIFPEAQASELNDQTTTTTTAPEPFTPVIKAKPPVPDPGTMIDPDKMTTRQTAQAMEAGTKKQFSKGLDDDPDDIKLQDFEDEITSKAEIYEKLLGGKDAKTQSFFRALAAGGLDALAEGTVTAGAKKFVDSLEGADDLSRKATLLAIQEKIAKDATKTPTKSQEVDILANRYMDGGMKRVEAYKKAEEKVYGDDKQSLLPGPTEERELFELTAAFAKSDDDLIAQNPSGFAQAELYKREGVKTIPYESFYDKDSQTTGYRATVGDEQIKPGEFYFDPVTFKFKYKTKAGESGFTYNLEEVKEKIS